MLIITYLIKYKGSLNSGTELRGSFTSKESWEQFKRNEEGLYKKEILVINIKEREGL